MIKLDNKSLQIAGLASLGILILLALEEVILLLYSNRISIIVVRDGPEPFIEGDFNVHTKEGTTEPVADDREQD